MCDFHTFNLIRVRKSIKSMGFCKQYQRVITLHLIRILNNLIFSIRINWLSHLEISPTEGDKLYQGPTVMSVANNFMAYNLLQT
jgi:hypothetical protein